MNKDEKTLNLPLNLGIKVHHTCLRSKNGYQKIYRFFSKPAKNRRHVNWNSAQNPQASNLPIFKICRFFTEKFAGRLNWNSANIGVWLLWLCCFMLINCSTCNSDTFFHFFQNSISIPKCPIKYPICKAASRKLTAETVKL